MRNVILWSLLIIFFASCSTKQEFRFVEQEFPDGKPMVVKFYKKDTKEGLIREVQYYDSGALYIEGEYKKNERHGTWTAYYRDGKVWSRAVFKKGAEDGLKSVYYENGQTYYEGVMKDTHRIGIWKFWDKDGNLVNEVDYDK